MYQQERLNNIMDIVRKNGYVTVKFLTEELHYSNATINRDLNILEKKNLIKRSYGGVEAVKNVSSALVFRYHKMKVAKNKIGKKAAEFIEDGDTIFIDASTTAQYIGKYITERKNLTVITNNMTLVSYLSEHNINAICLGGKVVEIPSMLSGVETVENAMKYYADKMFFSVGAISDDGKIGSSDLYYLLHKVMMQNSKNTFLLIDSGKINKPTKKFYPPDIIPGHIITDYDFEEKTKNKYKNTNFITIK